jgi:hypothetical protein
MSARGYSTLLVQKIYDANPCLLGVQLAKICVKLNIPVTDVAEYLDVTRPTVYSWFIGEREVANRHADRVEKLIEKLR